MKIKTTPDGGWVIHNFDYNKLTPEERKELIEEWLNKCSEPEKEGLLPPTPVPEWNIPVSEDMDADAFVQALIEIDRADFWHTATKEGLRTDLLKEVGYEFNLLTDETGWLAAKYLEKHLEGWPDSEKSAELMKKMYNASIRYSSVKGIIKSAKEDDRLPSCEERKLSELFKQSPTVDEIRNLIDLNVARWFIEEFKDDLTPKRKQLFDLYGSTLVGCKPYLSFVANGGYRMVKHMHDAMRFTIDKDGIQQLIEVYRTLRSGNSFTLKSDIYKDERAFIGPECTDILLGFIRKKLLKNVNQMFEAFDKNKTKIYSRYTSQTDDEARVYDAKPAILDDNNCEALDLLSSWLKYEDELYTKIQDQRIFYYGAYHIIDWPENCNETQKCIFLHRLAHLCGFDKIGRCFNIETGPDRRSTKDRIQNIIESYTKKDKDGKLLGILLRDVYR